MTEPYYRGEQVTLYLGDCLAVLASLPDSSVDAVVTDPPYSSGGMVRSDRMQSGHSKYIRSDSERGNALTDFTGDNRDQRAYAYWSALWMGEARRVTKPGGFVLTFTDWRQLPSTTDAIQAGGWVWRGLVPWHKPNSRPQAGRFSNECEYVAWGSHGSLGNDFTLPVFPGFYSLIPPRAGREHITQKPLELMRELVKIVTPGGLILDPFMGSGTTGAAAVMEGYGFIGVEQSEHFAGIAERRIQEAQGRAVARGEQSALDFGASA